MPVTRIFITLGFIAFALNLASPSVTQAQSTCPADQRRELVLTAVDKDANVIDKLMAEHLSLKVGRSTGTISDLVFQTKYPLDLAVLIDSSVSQEKSMPSQKLAAQAFVASVLTPGQDRVAVVSFSNKPNYLQPMTSDFSNLAAVIDQIRVETPAGYIGGGVVVSNRLPKPGPIAGSTSLWDSVRIVTTELFGPKTEKRRRVLLLFSDGIDTSSSEKFKTVIDEAIALDVTVFSIGFAGAISNTVDEVSLKKLSEQTGGVAEFPGTKKEKLEASLNAIARRLRGQYVIGYCGGELKVRAKLQLEVVDPEMRKAKPVLVYKRFQY